MRTDAVEIASPATKARADEEVREHCDLGNNSRCAHKTKSNHYAALAQRTNTLANIGSTDCIEHVVHSVWFKFACKSV